MAQILYFSTESNAGRVRGKPAKRVNLFTNGQSYQIRLKGRF